MPTWERAKADRKSENPLLLAWRKCLARDFQVMLSSKLNLTLLRKRTLSFQTNSLSGPFNLQSTMLGGIRNKNSNECISLWGYWDLKWWLLMFCNDIKVKCLSSWVLITPFISINLCTQFWNTPISVFSNEMKFFQGYNCILVCLSSCYITARDYFKLRDI